jgi:hypothetical protein
LNAPRYRNTQAVIRLNRSTTDSSNGRESTGYQVADMDATLTKGAAAGVKLLSQPIQTA